MAMNVLELTSILSPLIRSAHLSSGANDGPALTAFSASLANAIANGVVGYIKTNAQVLPLALVAPAGGGPVTGTGTVT